MKFSCEKALLLAAVNTASRAVSPKSSIPALEGLLLEADPHLTVSGYNMQTGIRTMGQLCSGITARRCSRYCSIWG